MVPGSDARPLAGLMRDDELDDGGHYTLVPLPGRTGLTAGSSSDPLPLPAPLPMAIADQAPGQSSSAASAPPPRRVFIVEGHRLLEETHGVLGVPGYYSRFSVTCRHHGPQRTCRKTRSYAASFAQASGLGDLEPVAFLGAWLASASTFATPAEHKRASPSVDEVRAYAMGQNWM